MSQPTTGWPPGLLQDDDRRLSKALANTPHARRHAEEAAAAQPVGWIEWHGGVCPVAPLTRVEVLQEHRHARGVALAFDWVLTEGPRAVWYWRLEREIHASPSTQGAPAA